MHADATRRTFLRLACALGVAPMRGIVIDPILAQLPAEDDEPPFPGGRLEAVIDFVDEPREVLDRAVGRGLNGRLRLNLRRLTRDLLVTPNDRFFIRTRCPDGIDYERPWSVRLAADAAQSIDIPADSLDQKAKSQGVHLLECSGNYGSFGLISAAEWSGVPLIDLLAEHDRLPDDRRILVRGFDEHARTPPNSTQGASWVFSAEQLRATGAFLATRMNGERLPRDHGFPVRLIVPGWYGCTCIKWVNEIELVSDDVPSTAHMREFASRTHQRGRPRRARGFVPASMDIAAMPVRIERWRVDGVHRYHVVGVIWGGEQTTDKLEIRFGRDGAFVPVEHCTHRTTRTWTMWTHRWTPTRPGRHDIRLRVGDPTIRTRRLDRGFYERTVEIDET